MKLRILKGEGQASPWTLESNLWVICGTGGAASHGILKGEGALESWRIFKRTFSICKHGTSTLSGKQGAELEDELGWTSFMWLAFITKTITVEIRTGYKEGLFEMVPWDIGIVLTHKGLWHLLLLSTAVSCKRLYIQTCCRMWAQVRLMSLKLPLPQLCWPVCLEVSFKEENYPCWMEVKPDFSRAFDLYSLETSWAVSECAGKIRLMAESSCSLFFWRGSAKHTFPTKRQERQFGEPGRPSIPGKIKSIGTTFASMCLEASYSVPTVCFLS